MRGWVLVFNLQPIKSMMHFIDATGDTNLSYHFHIALEVVTDPVGINWRVDPPPPTHHDPSSP